MEVVGARETALRLMGEHLHEASTVWRDGRVAAISFAGGCESPVTVEYTGRPSGVLEPDRKPVLFDLDVRCRRCGWCLRQRAREWATRAVSEINRARRTWSVTLTLSPQSHYVMLLRALERGSEPSFEARHFVISREITKMFKRVRKSTRASFRYFLVAEAHPGTGENAGLPHYHLLVHELYGQPELPVADVTVATRYGPRSQIRGPFHGQWPWGYVDMTEVAREDPEQSGGAAGAAWYTAKYLGKDARARVRASVRYGHEIVVLRHREMAGDEMISPVVF